MMVDDVIIILIVVSVSLYFLRLHRKLDAELRTLIEDATKEQRSMVGSLSELLVEEAATVTVPELAVPFVEFPCVCGTPIKLMQHLEPGQAAVINCDNCETSYSIHLPQIKIMPTEKFEPVWPFTKNQAASS